MAHFLKQTQLVVPIDNPQLLILPIAISMSKLKLHST